MKYKAIQRNARISPRKARLAAGLIRGKSVEKALNLLEFDNRRSSHFVRKVLQSAVANASNNAGIDPMDLKVSASYADEALVIKRFNASARGRAQPIAKRCSHITVIVERAEA